MDTVILVNDGHIQGGRDSAEMEPLSALGYRVQLDEGYRLAGYLRMLDQYPVLIKMSPFFPAFLERFRASGNAEQSPAGLERLEFAKTVEMIGYPGKPRLEIYNTLYGVRNGEAVDLKEFTFESLFDLPLMLGGVKHIVFGDTMEIFNFQTMYTFFEFLDGIAWELSFQGAPAQCAIRR
jgi:hypothetical protein